MPKSEFGCVGCSNRAVVKCYYCPVPGAGGPFCLSCYVEHQRLGGSHLRLYLVQFADRLSFVNGPTSLAAAAFVSAPLPRG